MTSLLLGSALLLGCATRVPAAPPAKVSSASLLFPNQSSEKRGRPALQRAGLADGELAEALLQRPGERNLCEGYLHTEPVSDITSRQEFGDHFLHVEFRTPEKGEGNAGVGLQGRYEVQIYNTFGRNLESTNGAAFYSQTPATYNASKKPGEWQTYDIFFRAPRFDAEGKRTENARATVFWNGVLVQNNGEFKGPTGIQYGEFRSESATGPIILQGDHEVVQYRNVWVIPQ